MASFYGNMKNNSRASYIFDKIYPSRTAMEAELNKTDEDGNKVGDGIFINRYVLIDYRYALALDESLITAENADDFYEPVTDGVTIKNYAIYYVRNETTINGQTRITYTHPSSYVKNTESTPITYYQKKLFVDRYKPDSKVIPGEIYEVDNQSITNLKPYINSLIETDTYFAHKTQDWDNYRATYDCTVWQKIYVENQERYIMIAELNAPAPMLEIIDDAPGCQNGSAHFDARGSSDINYIYYIPNNWDMIINKYNPDFDYSTVEDNEYYYYENDKDVNDLWYEPYVLTSDTSSKYNKTYYIITHTPVEVQTGKIIKNMRFYEKVENEYQLTQDQFALADKIYYQRKIEKAVGLMPGTKIGSRGYYEKNEQKKTYNNQVEYPYFNRRGFDKRVSTHVNDVGQGIYINEVRSTQNYPIHNFAHAGALTKSTFLPNRYYVYHGPKTAISNPVNYKFSIDVAYYIGPEGNYSKTATYKYVALGLGKDGKYHPTVPLKTREQYFYDTDLAHIEWFTKALEYQENTAYYELTWAVDSDGNKVVEPANDTYRIDMYFPEFGNAVADIYDVIYEAPFVKEDAPNEQFNNFIGYCTQEQWDKYQQNQNGIYWSGNRRFNLTQKQLDELSPEIYVGLYDIPVYAKTGSNIRLYSDERMRAALAPPYDNLKNENREFSMGWALTTLKRYISELRYLSMGDNEAIAGDGLGLQSDWTLEDDLAFGYVYHRPIVITKFTLTPDEYAIPNKDYYTQQIRNGVITYNKVNNLIANTNISGRNYYELPRSYLNDAERNNLVYIQCTESDTFNGLPSDDNLIGYCTEAELENFMYDNRSNYTTIDGARYRLNDQQLELIQSRKDLSLNDRRLERYIVGIYDTTLYYFWDGARYVPSYWMQKTTTVQPVCAPEYDTNESLLEYSGTYRLKINTQDIITHRAYNCWPLISDDKVVLYYDGKAIKVLPIETQSIDGISDAPHIPRIENLNKNNYTIASTRYQALQFLNSEIQQQQFGVDFSNYPDEWEFYEELPEYTKLSQFAYARLVTEMKRRPISKTIFDENKEQFYTKHLEPVVQEDYEIHNIWNEVLSELNL